MLLHILKNISKVLLCITVLLGTSCTKFLEEHDPSNLTPENYYTIPEHAEAAIAAVYADARFMGAGAGISSANFQMPEALTGTITTENAQNSDLTNLVSLVFDGNNLHIIQWWNSLYKIIAQANLVIEKVPDIHPMDDAQKQQILGEALFFRAWAYFYAVRLWGDVPLITRPQTASSEDFMPARIAQETVYQQIVDDLQAAENSGFAWTNTTGRISLAAVKAQLARVYLTMAGYPLNKGAAYYTLAAAKSNEIVTYANDNPTQIGLFADYADLHKAAQNNRLEHLFQIQHNADISGNPMQLYLLPLLKPISVMTGGWGTYVPTVSFYNSYEPGDKRAQDQVGYFYTSYYTNGSGAVFELGAPYIFKHFDAIAHGSPGIPGTARSNLNVTQIRFAEVLLMYAEAQNESGTLNQDAYNAFKRIRDRAELITPDLNTYTQQTFREAVWKERWHELCYEGITFFDMLRLRKVLNETTGGFDDFVGHINRSSNQPLQTKHLLLPLPVPEMANNPNLKDQNEGY